MDRSVDSVGCVYSSARLNCQVGTGVGVGGGGWVGGGGGAGVLVGVEVGVRVGRGVRVGVRVGVSVGIGVRVGVGVMVGVGVATGVEVKVGWRVLMISVVGVGSSAIATSLSKGEARVQPVSQTKARKNGRMEGWKTGGLPIFQPSNLPICR